MTNIVADLTAFLQRHTAIPEGADQIDGYFRWVSGRTRTKARVGAGMPAKVDAEDPNITDKVLHRSRLAIEEAEAAVWLEFIDRAQSTSNPADWLRLVDTPEPGAMAAELAHSGDAVGAAVAALATVIDTQRRTNEGLILHIGDLHERVGQRVLELADHMSQPATSAADRLGEAVASLEPTLTALAAAAGPGLGAWVASQGVQPTAAAPRPQDPDGPSENSLDASVELLVSAACDIAARVDAGEVITDAQRVRLQQLMRLAHILG